MQIVKTQLPKLNLHFYSLIVGVYYGIQKHEKNCAKETLVRDLFPCVWVILKQNGKNGNYYTHGLTFRAKQLSEINILSQFIMVCKCQKRSLTKRTLREIIDHACGPF